MAANVIELVARYRDEGAIAGMQRTTQQATTLSTALGIGIGAGVAGAAAFAAIQLSKLATAPLEAARAFGQMVERVDMGNDAFRKARSAAGEAERGYRNLFAAVGVEGVQAFRELAAAQRAADDAWQQMMANVSLSVAGPLTMAANLIEMITRGMLTNPAAFAALQEARQVTDTEHRQMLITGPQVAEIINRIAVAEDKRAEAIRKQAEAFEHRRRQAEAAHLGITVTAKRPDFSNIVRGAGEEGKFPRLDPMFTEIRDLATAAGKSVATSLEFIAANFTNKMQTLGSAAKAFWNSLVSDILASLARLGLASLGTFLIGLGIGGPAGAFLSAAGAAMGGKRPGVKRAGRGRSEGGDTYIFQGLNTRDMFMEVGLRSGSLARANDLVLMRSEAG